jgi:hypothetical protein
MGKRTVLDRGLCLVPTLVHHGPGTAYVWGRAPLSGFRLVFSSELFC